jgi:two-component system sensor histidine kinase PilS (NtrC family)
VLRTLKSERRLAAALEPRQVLYWIYAARLLIALSVFGAALLVSDLPLGLGRALTADTTIALAALGLGAAAVLTPLAYLISHRGSRLPSVPFLLSQAVLDIFLVNAAVFITGGYQSPFVSLFIALAAAYALVLPLAAAIPVTLATGVVYVLASTVGQPAGVSVPLLLAQVAMFTLVAIVASIIGVRLRVVRHQLRSIEGELRRLELDTADVLRIIPSGVVTVDDEGRLAYLNLAAAEILGIDIEETLGLDVRPVLERLSTDLVAAIDETVQRRRRIRNREIELHPPETGGTGTSISERMLGRGTPIPVALSSALLQGSGGETSCVLLLQDLRPVRQLEDLRLRTGRLEAVAELSASLAHELKNPLASVRSAAEQLARSAFDDEDDRILSRLIVRESDRLDGILREFSDFARVDVTARRPIDVARLIAEVLETVRSHPAADGRATLEADVTDDLSGLWGDPELLHRTLLNLVLNAVQVGDPTASVRVRVVADALRPDLVPGEISLGNPVRIRVIDDGPGIEAEDLPRIFDPFYTRRQGGSGLGLSIAHRAVQAHGGALLASSVPGEGATFAVVLPRRAARSRELYEERMGRTADSAPAADADGRPGDT